MISKVGRLLKDTKHTVLVEQGPDFHPSQAGAHTLLCSILLKMPELNARLHLEPQACVQMVSNRLWSCRLLQRPLHSTCLQQTRPPNHWVSSPFSFSPQTALSGFEAGGPSSG